MPGSARDRPPHDRAGRRIQPLDRGLPRYDRIHPQRLEGCEHPRAHLDCLRHSQACFITEGLYLDHGGNPYNGTFKGTGQPAPALLIDHATYLSWFGTGTDYRSEGCDKIGHQVDVLAGS